MGFLQGVNNYISATGAPPAKGNFSPSRGDVLTVPQRGTLTEGSVRRNILYVCLVLLSIPVLSQEKKERRHYLRIAGGPVLSFYQNNKYHTNDSKPRYAVYGAIFDECRLSKDFAVMTGLEYAYHGLTFNSYYLAPGYQYLYNGNYDYNYRLILQEARLNLLAKQVIGIETRNIVTGYTACGIVMRYLLKSDLLVTSNKSGEELFSGKPDISFEHDLFRKNMAMAVKFVAGAQRNFFKSHRAFFFETCFTFSLSRFYLKESFTPSSLYINGSFLQLGLGVKI